MCWVSIGKKAAEVSKVSVAGCLGYDVLDRYSAQKSNGRCVSVAGCLGYDVLGFGQALYYGMKTFQLLVV